MERPARVSEKAGIRARVRAVLRGMRPEERSALSRRACARLLASPEWIRARRVLGYAALADEPDLSGAWEAALGEGKELALPRFDDGLLEYRVCLCGDLKGGLRRGKFGVLEPGSSCPEAAWEGADLILVPGIAFDLRGARLGRGQGYYDRLLKRIGGYRCGVAFEAAIVEALPVEPHDVPMDCILTPDRWIIQRPVLG